MILPRSLKAFTLKHLVVKMGYLTIFSEMVIWKSLKNNETKSKEAPLYDQPIARKSSSKLPVTSILTLVTGWEVTS